MSHTVTVKMIADQYITIDGQEYNIHDIATIYIDSDGQIMKVALNKMDKELMGILNQRGVQPC
uniref:Uncharacterized protein n=1 Tax=viral metagenome TaxID=1070528 RepID=A0A6M3KVM7_9ZZZZ